MIAPEYLCVLLLTAPWLIVSAATCPDLRNATENAYNLQNKLCVYVLDIEDLRVYYTDKDYDTLNIFDDMDLDKLYDDLLSHNGNIPISGRGYWETSTTIDAYYVAFRQPDHLEWLQSWWPDVLIEEYLLKQYILTSFINCIPLDVENGFFRCYGGDTEGGEYVRELKNSDCRSEHGSLVPIEHGLDVCGVRHVAFGSSGGFELGRPSVELKGKSGKKGSYCKLYRDGLNMTALDGVKDGHCSVTVNSAVHNLVCCAYGRYEGSNIYKFLPKFGEMYGLLSHEEQNKQKIVSANKVSFCAAFGEVSIVGDWRGDWINPVFGYGFKTVELIMHARNVQLTHFNEVCSTSIHYTFLEDGTTEITHEAAANSLSDCPHTGYCRTIYDRNQSYICPFEFKENYTEKRRTIGAKCCCRGFFCNYMKENLFGTGKEAVTINANRHCVRPALAVEPLYDAQMDKMFPHTYSKCMRTMDVRSGLEIHSLPHTNVIPMSTVSRVALMNETTCTLHEVRLSVDVGEYVQECPSKNSTFVEEYSQGMPWTVFTCECSDQDCDATMDPVQYYQAFTNFTSCYEYNGHHAEYKTSDHNDQVRNKQSLRCFIRIDESEEYGLIVEAGAFAGERGLLLAKEFDERCNGNTSSCFYSNKTLGSSMCCCYGDLCNGPPLRAEALQFHVNQTVLAGDIGKPKSTICLRKDGLVAPCAFSRTLISMGCYGERPHHIKRFNNIGCLYRDNVTWGGSSICEQELMAGRPPFCRWNEEARHIFCCCRDDECKRLRHISLGEYGLKKNTERHSWMALSYVLWVCYISLYLIEGSTEG